ncbi:MAG: DUF11 domain-containing protein [Cytophagales bacterium]|nr:MAG: DUF11 domain-containing protein [Cytophagales bacterium]
MKSYYQKNTKQVLSTLLGFVLFCTLAAIQPAQAQETTTVQDLLLTSMCSDAPEVSRRWRVRNPNSFPINVDWEVYGANQTGKVVAPPGDSYFFTNTVGTTGHPNTTKIYWKDASNTLKSTVKASGGAKCEYPFDACKVVYYVDHGSSSDGISNIYTVDANLTTNVATTKLYTSVPYNSVHIALHPNGKRLYVIEEGGRNTFGYIDVTTKQYVFVSELKSGKITQVAFHPNGKIYFSSMDSDKVFSINDLDEPVIEDLGQVTYNGGILDINGADIAFTQTGAFYLATIAYKGQIFRITGGKGALQAEKIGNERNRRITGLAILDNGKGSFIHSSNSLKEMSVLDINTGDRITDLKLEGDITTMNWGDMSSSCMETITPPDPIGGCSAAEVVEFKQGLNSKGTAVALDRSDPTKALGAPQGGDAKGSFVSLGFNGHIILKFSDAIINGNGNDLRVVETSYGNPTCAKYPEHAEVFASQDGVNWVSLGSQCLDSEYDLGSLEWAQYVKVVDKSNPKSFGNDGDGYDVDGVVCLNGSKPVPTATADCDEVVGGSSNPTNWSKVTLSGKAWGDDSFRNDRVKFDGNGTNSGVGIAGGRFPEVDYNKDTRESEAIRVDFRKEFTGATVTLKRFYGLEDARRDQAETGYWIAYDKDNNEVGRGGFTGVLPLNTDGHFEFSFSATKPFVAVEFYPGVYTQATGNATAFIPDNSDFLLHKIVPTCKPILACGDVVGGSSNPTNWEKVTITGKGWGDANFNTEKVKFDGSGTNSGVGISGGRFPEVDYNKLTGESEVIRFNLHNTFTGATVTLKRFYGLEDARRDQAETGCWIAYNAAGEEVGHGNFTGVKALGTDGHFEFQVSTSEPFTLLELRPGIYVKAAGNATAYVPDNSDFLVHKIVPTCAPVIACDEQIGGSGLPIDWSKAKISGKAWGDTEFSAEKIAYDNSSNGRTGIGVQGGRLPQICYNKDTRESEVLRVDMGREFNGAYVILRRLYGFEDDNNSKAETGNWTAYNAKGEKVGEGSFVGTLSLSSNGNHEFSINVGKPFQTLEFRAGVYANAVGYGMLNGYPDNSDYLVHKIIPTCEVITPQTADLAVVKTVNKAQAQVGEDLTYSIKVTNAGPGVAKGVVLTDIMPSSLTNIRINGAAFSNSTADLGDFNVGQSKTVTITATATAIQEVRNTASVLAKSTADSNPNNNSSTAVTQVNGCPNFDLTVSPVVASDAAVVYNDYTYEVQVSNSSTTAAQTQAAITLPNEVELMEAVVSINGQESAISDLSQINLGTLSNNDNVVIRVRMQFTSVGGFNISTQITASNACGSDVNTADNSLVTAVDVSEPMLDILEISTAAFGEDQVILFPNPFVDKFNVAFPESISGNVRVRVFSAASGNVLLREIPMNNATEVEVSVPSTIGAGLYFVEVSVQETKERNGSMRNATTSYRTIKTFKVEKR